MTVCNAIRSVIVLFWNLCSTTTVLHKSNNFWYWNLNISQYNAKEFYWSNLAQRHINFILIFFHGFSIFLLFLLYILYCAVVYPLKVFISILCCCSTLLIVFYFSFFYILFTLNKFFFVSFLSFWMRHLLVSYRVPNHRYFYFFYFYFYFLFSFLYLKLMIIEWDRKFTLPFIIIIISNLWLWFNFLLNLLSNVARFIDSQQYDKFLTFYRTI